MFLSNLENEVQEYTNIIDIKLNSSNINDIKKHNQNLKSFHRRT